MKTMIETKARAIPDSLIDKLEHFLGPRGVRYFRLLNTWHGEVSPVLKLHQSRKHVPAHSVHFNEGMQIRNFMRRQEECSSWTCHDFDDNWAVVVEMLLKRNKSKAT